MGTKMRQFPKAEILVVWAGRHRRDQWEKMYSQYRQRIARQVRIREIAVRAGHGEDPSARLRAEGEKILSALPETSRLVVLDSRGAARPSKEFAGWLGKQLEADQRPLVFVLGSDLGVPASVQEKANETLSFGPMTLAHELARLVLFEQLFRGLSILSGMKYHREPL